MASREHAGPSRKRVGGDNSNNYCGLEAEEAAYIRNIVGDEKDLYLDSDDYEEPFVDSGSEYIPSCDESDEESAESGVEETNVEEKIETSTETNDTLERSNEDAGETDYSRLNLIWTENDFQPMVHIFDDSGSGVKTDSLNENSLEIDYFLNLFTESMAEDIIRETNRYAMQQQEKNWKDVDIGEFFIFIALSMLMTRSKKLDVKEYWSLDPLLHTPVFGKYMSRDRYLQILKNLHFANNEEADPNNRLYKVKNILERVKQRFQSQFYPFQNLVIDESMILFKGRLSFKQYIKTKRHRFGIKLYVLCDCETGIVLDFIVYIGQDTYKMMDNVTGLGLAGCVKPYLNKGHSLFTDNFYSSPSLSMYLFDHKTNSCGTVRANRRHMPNLSEKLKKGDISWRSCNNLLVFKWKDRRDVTMITTMHENKFITLDKIDRLTDENVKKPLCVLEYNEKMGAVDRSDMMISSIDCMRKSVKWYKKLYFHTIDICLLNAHAMWSTKNPVKMSLAKFQLNLIRQIISRFGTARKSKSVSMPDLSRLKDRHFPCLVPETPKSKVPSRRCVVCSHTEQGQKKRKVSRYMCQICDVGLCIVPCFETYHTKSKF
ncbi:hypothetical protein NQ318_023623 [Aromia moschata]|uniref:PiggyBac transposable element-derived protein 4 n=1 Tax=Aromia moschata TaxID=1265417 RepID=A0AAV8YRE8_9CUCU|nr:hypothetical protein NQ318_023623 [Aromia moschata]